MALDALATREKKDIINDGGRPAFEHSQHQTVYDVAVELLVSGTLDDAEYTAAVDVLGHARPVNTVSTVGYFCQLCMMANVGGAVPQDTPPVKLKNQDR